jgi:hypothetical protein
MDLHFNEDALRELGSAPEVERFVGSVGGQVADRANARAATVLASHGGGGIGSVESHLQHDNKGAFARIAPDPAHSYMWFAELGTEHERPRPFIRPALYARQGTAAANNQPGVARTSKRSSRG